jgi:hypothetical protein
VTDAEASRSWAEAAVSILLTTLAGLFVLIAGLAIVFVLPAALVIVAMGYPGETAAAAGWGNWLFFAWFPLAFAGAVYTIVVGLQAVDEPTAGVLLKLVGVTLLVFFTFPPFLFPAP